MDKRNVGLIAVFALVIVIVIGIVGIFNFNNNTKDGTTKIDDKVVENETAAMDNNAAKADQDVSHKPDASDEPTGSESTGDVSLATDKKDNNENKVSTDKATANNATANNATANNATRSAIGKNSSDNNRTSIGENSDNKASDSTSKTKAPTSNATKAPTSKATNSSTASSTAKATVKATKKAASDSSADSSTPYGKHGKLKVSGTKLVDKNGDAFQLKGVSTHGIAWFGEYVNEDAFSTWKSFGANVVRLAMYTADYNGYENGGDKTALEKKIDDGVKYATDLGMYVIIDWHILSDGNPNTYKSDAKNFFDKMSKKYKNYGNVIFEICNEPNNVSWSDVKSYADEVIATIRNNNKDAIIIVGTPTWSQDVDTAIANPVAQPKNVMYALHFYAATHKQWLRDRVKNAIDNGAPVFVSEFSICDASGNGSIDYDEADAWMKFINDNKLSCVMWSLANKAETASLISSSCTKTSGWSTSDLSDTGKWWKKNLK